MLICALATTGVSVGNDVTADAATPIHGAAWLGAIGGRMCKRGATPPRREEHG